MALKFNLIHLKYFYDSVRLGSVTAAAAENYVCQSAVSQGCARLEQSLGVCLTHHRKNRFDLTQDGKLVYRHASRLLGQIDEMECELKGGGDELVGRLSIVTVNSLAVKILPKTHRQVMDAHPRLKIELHRGGLQFIKQSLYERSADFGLILDAPTFSGFASIGLKEGVYKVYGRQGASMDDLRKGILVDNASAPEVVTLCNACQEHLGFTPPILYELSGWSNVEAFAAEGVGLALLPSFCVSDSGLSSLQTLELPFSLPSYRVSAIYNEGEQLSRAAHAFLDIVRGA